MRGVVVVLVLSSMAVAACATISGLDELAVCDGSACADVTTTNDGGPDVLDASPPDVNDASTDVGRDSGDAADVSVDAPIKLACGNEVCLLDGGSGCCVEEGGAPFCWNGADCVGYFLTCTGKTQCPSGQVCCGSSLPTGSAQCVTSCSLPNIQLCAFTDPSPVCAGNKTCQKISAGVLANVAESCQ